MKKLLVLSGIAIATAATIGIVSYNSITMEEPQAQIFTVEAENAEVISVTEKATAEEPIVDTVDTTTELVESTPETSPVENQVPPVEYMTVQEAVLLAQDLYKQEAEQRFNITAIMTTSYSRNRELFTKDNGHAMVVKCIDTLRSATTPEQIIRISSTLNCI